MVRDGKMEDAAALPGAESKEGMTVTKTDSDHTHPSLPPSLPHLRAKRDVPIQVPLAPVLRVPNMPRGDVRDDDDLLPSLLRGLELSFDPVL